MAIFNSWFATVTVKDGANRDSIISINVPAATAQAYLAAADDAARAASTVGALLTAAVAATGGAEVKRSVSIESITDPVTIPAEEVLRGNKVVLGVASGGANFTMTLPCRDASKYTPKPDSIEIDIDANGPLKTFIGLYNAGAVSVRGSSVRVTKAYVND